MTTVAAEARSTRVVQRIRHTVLADVRVRAVPEGTRADVVDARARWMVVTVEDRGPSARVAALILGDVATAVAVAVMGSVTATRNVVVGGVPAEATAMAPNASVSVNEELPGQTAQAYAVAPTGAVSTQRHTSVVGLVAEATAVALVGVVTAEGNVTLSGSTATADAEAPAGAVSVE